MAKILVTGSLGVLGTKVVAALKQMGHDVWGADIAHDHNEKYFKCDVSKFRQVETVLTSQKFDYVYHLAAEFGRWNGEDYYENLWASNVVGTKNIIRMQERLGFKLIHFSSSEVYGDYNDVMKEDVMDRVEVKQMNDYAMTKWVNEMQILNSADQFKTNTVRVRIFNTYGPGEYYSTYRSVACRFCYSALYNMPYTVFENHTRTHTYIEDSARWIAKICDNFKSGEVYNIAGTHRTTIRELSDSILKYLGKDSHLVTYKESEPYTTKDKIVDNSKMLRDLGSFTETPFEVGIANTINWMREIYRV